jgi:hypothetical protein
LCEAQSSAQGNWNFKSVSGSIINFDNGNAFNTHLHELKYIGQIQNGNRSPFFIFSGRDCDECDANISIYIHSPINGKLSIEYGKNRYQYPGKERNIEDNSLTYKGRAFYGQVLKNTIGVIWFEEQLMENNSWEKSTYLVKIINGKKKEISYKNSTQLTETLQLLKQGLCKEIKGIDYTSEP